MPFQEKTKRRQMHVFLIKRGADRTSTKSIFLLLQIDSKHFEAYLYGCGHSDNIRV